MTDQTAAMRVLITGASGGIGRAVACRFAAAPDDVRLFLHYCSDRAGAEACRRETAHGAEVKLLQADLCIAEGCARLVADAVRLGGGLDVLVCNAGGIYGAQTFAELSAEDWDRTVALNMRAPFLLARAAFEVMCRQGRGRIILISSVAAKYGGGVTSLHYGAAKAGAEAVMRGLSRAGAKQGVLVNTIRAGFVDTAFHEKMGRTPEQIAERVRLIPVGRAGRPEDVAALVAYLAGPGGDFITGEILTVAGGD